MILLWKHENNLIFPIFRFFILMSLTFRLTRDFANSVTPSIQQQTFSLLHNARRSSSVFISNNNNTNNSRYLSTKKITKNNKSNIIMKAKAITGMDEMSKGEFRRSASTFRDFIRADGSTPYTPESGRYHLIISYACPWACRCLAMIQLKGLDDTIGVTVTNPLFHKTRPEDDEDTHCGWVFEDSDDKFLDGAKTVRKFYENHSDTANKFTVPILYDKVRKEIVNNESSEILRMIGQEMNSFATKNQDWDPYPENLKESIDSVNEWIYPKINNGVYRTGFASTQEAYNAAVNDVFQALDKVEDILSKQRYVASSTAITEADIRLFVTLVRFDEVYHGHFKCNRKYIREYEHLTNYVREIYQITGMPQTVNMYHIKQHYHRSHPSINKFGIVPVGSNTEENFKKSHNRNDLFPLEHLSLY